MSVLRSVGPLAGGGGMSGLISVCLVTKGLLVRTLWLAPLDQHPLALVFVVLTRVERVGYSSSSSD